LEIAQQEGWPELQWAAIGRELGKLTKKKTIKRHGKRHVAYLLRYRRRFGPLAVRRGFLRT
jgi:hypothetical protein